MSEELEIVDSIPISHKRSGPNAPITTMIMAAAMGSSFTGSTINPDYPLPRRPRRKSERKTEADMEALAKAQAKRDRKAAAKAKQQGRT